MIFLGPGFNCLRPGYWYHYNMLPDEVRARVDAGEEHIKIKMRYGGVGILRRDFCENTLAYEIDFSQPLPIHCPVRIIHAVQVTSGSSITQKVPVRIKHGRFPTFCFKLAWLAILRIFG